MERIIQFGEGNFLRAFVDWMMEPGSVVVVKPRPGKGLENLLNHGCRYNVCVQGMQAGKVIDEIEEISSIAAAINPYEQYDEYLKLAETPHMQIVVSNTTEAGIAFDPECKMDDMPALSYPGKLTQLLYHRWKHFEGATDKGLTILPCELIFHNGTNLRKCIHQYIELWHLEEAFLEWVDKCCPIYNTLVDRIVSGAPTEEEQAAFEKRLIEERRLKASEVASLHPIFVKAEPYHLWVIEAPETVKSLLPLRDADINIVFTDDEHPYHERKVTLLNAPHTVMSAIGTEMGLETVRDCMLHPTLGPELQALMREELLPTLLPMGFRQEELESYANDITDRFLNPFLHHRLSSIRLNAISKCKARLLPPIERYQQINGRMPEILIKGLIANVRLG